MLNMLASSPPGLLEVSVIIAVVLISLLINILYINTLSKALRACSPDTRTMSPGMVWLLLVPVLNIIWQFFVVLRISDSLGREFKRLNITEDVADVEENPGKTLGLTMSIMACLSVIPYLGALTGLIAFICWIMYWLKISRYTRYLQQYAAD